MDARQRLNPAYLIAAFGSVFYGGADFYGGLAARRATALAVTFLSGFAAMAVLFLGMPFVAGVTRPADLAWGAAAGAFGGFGAMLIYRALAIGPVSVASPVLSITGLALPVLVGYALGERPALIAVVGLFLAPLSIVLLAQDGGRDPAQSPSRVLGPALLAGAVVGFFLVFMGRIESGANLWPMVAARVVGILVLLAVILARSESPWPAPAARGMSLLAGTLDSLANLAFVFAVQRASLALVSALVSLSPATAALLAKFILGERWSLAQKGGLLLALASGACISLG